MRLRYIFLISILLTISAHLSAQNDRQLVRIGNRFFYEQNYAKAEIEYRKAIASNGGNTQAIYNLGCALQAQKKDSAAIKQYELAGKIETNKIRKSKSYHNIGVICQSHQMYKEAIEAYKESLRNNPGVLCKRLQKNQKNQNDKQQNKEDNKDKKNKDKKQENKDNQQQKQQQSNEQMSKDNAEQLLNAAIQEEKATQQRLKKSMQKPQKRNLDKNW